VQRPHAEERCIHRCIHTCTVARVRVSPSTRPCLPRRSLSFFIPPSNHVSNKHRQVSMILILRDMFCTNLLLLRRNTTKDKRQPRWSGAGLFELRECDEHLPILRLGSISKSSGNLGTTTDEGVMTRSLPTSLLEAIHVSGCKEFYPWPVLPCGIQVCFIPF
jgi:hypothetical protein